MSKIEPDNVSQVRKDFDRIALLTESHGIPGDSYIIPARPTYPAAFSAYCRMKDGIPGCLPVRAQNFTALDLSPEMVRVAKTLSTDYGNVGSVLGDFLELPLAAEGFDCIVSIATLHHLPLEPALLKMIDTLRPGGVLVIHDLVETGMMMNAFAYPVSVLRRFLKTGHARMPKAMRVAWDEHGRNDVYLTMDQVREMHAKYLPGARVKHHLLWRYSIVWLKGTNL